MNPDTITTPVQTVENGLSTPRSDLLAIEEPLQFCLNGFPLSITMRSPGHDLDLATGFLFTEGIINDVTQILSMHCEPMHREPAPEEREATETTETEDGSGKSADS